ncbi:hypothetical protein EJ063_10970 [Vibrio aquaticus]|uniref:Pilus assembly protein CpaD n=1 Tax=Vibrio aquaticus TaxID=2496559 RepID=A0A432CV59_9VIBR|nr:hypothetical protein [Vibrio aquaticus]RTZ15592.1 hypothetical protein EJ063_10970 [Vibrio aquaticus]
MNKPLKKSLLIAVAAMGLSACAEVITLREGSSVQVVPMTYTWAVSLDSKGTNQAQQEIEKIMSNNWPLVANKGVSISWATSAGKKLADAIEQALIQQGVDGNNVTVTQETLPYSQDIRVQFNEAQVVTQSCTPVVIGSFGKKHGGCYAENARWHSMVNPENMIAAPAASESVGGTVQIATE